MIRNEYLLSRISMLTGVDIFRFQGGNLQGDEKNTEYNPIREQKKFCDMLIEIAEGQEVPVLYQDAHQVFFGCVKSEKGYVLFGPMSLKRLSRVELHNYHMEYGMPAGMEKALPVFPFAKILAIAEVITKKVTGREYDDDELIKENHLVTDMDESIKKEQILFKIREEDAELYHHTYQEERRLLECVRTGKVEEALKYNVDMDMGTGRLSKNESEHWKNVAVVGITLCTRAAIEGGLSPATAYQLSDFYIQKANKCKDVISLIACRNQAVKELTERVWEKMNSQRTSSYIEQCKDYISKHYREKIYLKDLAEMLGLSSSYLSRLFSRELGMGLQDYINWSRIENAENLLAYSDESIAHIGEYVGFPTQSYFGSIFKKYKNMTPKEYRNRYKPTEL
ncbi:AraC family transcriptional regulator [Anaerobium acetethylicum]|nr:AraC family transcriptional regulator [Anaerobium acetethylicum]